MDKKLSDLIEIIHFTENLSTKIHGLADEAEIYRTIKEEFNKSTRYTSSIYLLTSDGLKLKVAETSLAPEKMKKGEKLAGIHLKDYQINLRKSSIFRQVVKKGKTIQINVNDLIDELFPKPLALLIAKSMGYWNKKCILTPLRQKEKIIGSFSMTSTELTEYFIPSVKNLAQHISTALELARECKAHQQTGEKLRQLVESQKEFIASLGHELRTSLSVIKAAAEKEINNMIVPSESWLLINDKVDQITQIIQNLLLLSRLDTGQELTHKTKFNLRGLLEEVLVDTINWARREGIAPQIIISCPKITKLKTDRSKISIVLTNLLQNAIVHSNSKPRIHLKTHRHQNNLQIIVEDNNLPIPQKDLKKIFERFYKSKHVGRKSHGLGLGLNISSRLVELLAGRIWAETKNNFGNKFIVQLPT